MLFIDKYLFHFSITVNVYIFSHAYTTQKVSIAKDACKVFPEVPLWELSVTVTLVLAL